MVAKWLPLSCQKKVLISKIFFYIKHILIGYIYYIIYIIITVNLLENNNIE